MNKKIQSQVLKEVVEELVRFEIGKKGVTAEQQARHIIDIIADKQKAEFRKMIEKLIEVRKRSHQWGISDYQEVFSINDLNSILAKLNDNHSPSSVEGSVKQNVEFPKKVTDVSSPSRDETSTCKNCGHYNIFVKGENKDSCLKCGKKFQEVGR